MRTGAPRCDRLVRSPRERLLGTRRHAENDAKAACNQAAFFVFRSSAFEVTPVPRTSRGGLYAELVLPRDSAAGEGAPGA